jgi:hypothetical protein
MVAGVLSVGLGVQCFAKESAELQAVVHHEGVQYVIEKLNSDGGTAAKWFVTDVASVARKEINIPAGLSGVVIVEGDCAYYLDEQKLFRVALREGSAKVVAESLSGFLQDAYSYAGGYVLIIADSSGWHYLRLDGAGKSVVALDIPVTGNLRTSTVQGGILILSFAGENDVGTNIFRIDLASNKLLPHSDRIARLEDVGVDIWLTRVVVHKDESRLVIPFDSPIQYFKRYRNDYIICTMMRLYCASQDQDLLLSATDIRNCTYDGQVVLTAKGPVAIEPSGKIIYDLFSQPEQ